MRGISLQAEVFQLDKKDYAQWHYLVKTSAVAFLKLILFFVFILSLTL
jgi:hypothetical protein